MNAGVFAVASAGGATVTNSGSITVVSGSDAAVGVFARADYGTASVTSSGDIEASSAYLAYGVIARGADAVVVLGLQPRRRGQCGGVAHEITSPVRLAMRTLAPSLLIW